MAFVTQIREMHVNSSSETIKGSYQTGIIDISGKYDRANIVRRINLHYDRASVITCKAFADGELSGTALFTITFPANSSGDKIVSRRPTAGGRAKAISILLETANDNNSAVIRKLEIEIDG